MMSFWFVALLLSVSTKRIKISNHHLKMNRSPYITILSKLGKGPRLISSVCNRANNKMEMFIICRSHFLSKFHFDTTNDSKETTESVTSV